MSWTVTLEVVDCASASTKLAGASVLDGSTSATATTDANGRVSYTKDDTLNAFIVKINLLGFIGKNKSISQAADKGTTVTVCLAASPTGTADPNVPTGAGGNGGGCFIVSATTGSADSEEVNHLRALRDQVSGASRLGGQLIDVIYREYYQFSPDIAAELQQDGEARVLVLSLIVRPLLAWYSLAGTLALEQSNEQAVRQATRDVANACPPYLGGASIISLLEAIRGGEALPADSHPLLLEFAARFQEAAQLRFASWAILDPLIRVWRSATDQLDVVDEVAQWLATAPLEALAPPSDPELLELELGVLASFFDFRPAARGQLAARLTAAWPAEVGALNRAGFVSQVTN